MRHSKLATGVYGSITAITLWGFGLAPAHAQEFPTRTVKLIVSTTAGGGGDVLARAIADKLSTLWGQSVIVEQRTGANGMIATAALVKASADGYTAFMSLSALVQNLLLQPNPGYTMPDVQSKIYDIGLEPVSGSAEDFVKVIDADMKLWSKVIKDTGIKLV